MHPTRRAHCPNRSEPVTRTRSLVPTVLLVAGLLGNLLGCTSDQSSPNSPNLHFEETLRIGSDDPEAPNHQLFSQVAAATVDSSGTIYAVDAQTGGVRVHDEGGTFQRSFGTRGQGPGEFQDPSGLIVGASRLYVENQFGQQIDVWTTEGDFVDRHTFPEEISLVTLVGFAENHLIVSETGFGDEPQQIHALDPSSWEPVHSFPVDLDLDLPEGLASPASVTTVGDSIYVSRVTEYTLRRYATDGTLGRVIERDVDVLVGPGVQASGDRRGIRTYSHLSAPLRLPSGNLLTWASWPTNVDDPDAHLRRSRNDAAEEAVYAASLDLFDANGRYVGSRRWNDRRSPPLGRPACIGPNGTLYTTTNDPFPQVRRYEVTLRTD